MQIHVNGKSLSISTATTLLSVVEMVCGTPIPTGVAVALNSTVISRSQWEQTTLEADDQVEVLWASSGG